MVGAVGGPGEDVVPWTLITDVPARAGEYALNHEAFCGVLAEVSLEAQDATEFLDRAVPFVNDSIWGSLSAGMLVHPTTEDEHGEAVERALSELRYGGIAVNVWPAVSYALGVTSWGAFPGNEARDIGSAPAWSTTPALRPSRSPSSSAVPRASKPPGSRGTTRRTLAGRLTELEAAPSWSKLVGVALGRCA